MPVRFTVEILRSPRRGRVADPGFDPAAPLNWDPGSRRQPRAVCDVPKKVLRHVGERRGFSSL